MTARYFFGIFPLDDERDAFAEAAWRQSERRGTEVTLIHPADLHLPLAAGPDSDKRQPHLEGRLVEIGSAVRFRPGTLAFNRVDEQLDASGAGTCTFVAGASPRSILDAAALLSRACAVHAAPSQTAWTPHMTWGIVPASASGKHIAASPLDRPLDMTLLGFALAWGPLQGPCMRIAEWSQMVL